MEQACESSYLLRQAQPVGMARHPAGDGKAGPHWEDAGPSGYELLYFVIFYLAGVTVTLGTVTVFSSVVNVGTVTVF